MLTHSYSLTHSATHSSLAHSLTSHSHIPIHSDAPSFHPDSNIPQKIYETVCINRNLPFNLFRSTRYCKTYPTFLFFPSPPCPTPRWQTLYNVIPLASLSPFRDLNSLRGGGSSHLLNSINIQTFDYTICRTPFFFFFFFCLQIQVFFTHLHSRTYQGIIKVDKFENR